MIGKTLAKSNIHESFGAYGDYQPRYVTLKRYFRAGKICLPGGQFCCPCAKVGGVI